MTLIQESTVTAFTIDLYKLVFWESVAFTLVTFCRRELELHYFGQRAFSYFPYIFLIPYFIIFSAHNATEIYLHNLIKTQLIMARVGVF